MKKLTPLFPLACGAWLLTGVGPTPRPTPTVGTLPAPTPTPGGPVLPSPDVARAQDGAISHVRRLIRDVQSNTDSIKAVGNFGAQLYLIDDADFYQNWKKPETPTLTPVQLGLPSSTTTSAVWTCR